VTRLQDVGTHVLLTAHIGEHVLKARLAPTADLPPAGATAWLQVMTAHTCFYRNEELV
jgi:glycerol transport system ATP-binding protein